MVTIMTTRYNAKKGAGGKADLGYQEGEQVTGLDIPSCTIEDVDRSVFNLFEHELNFTVKSNKKPTKVPVIFATGERFALLARKKPLRDSSSALILPLISIMRTGVDQSQGIGENVPLVVKRRLAPEDAEFQNFVNKQGIKNSDELAKNPKLETGDGESEDGVKMLKDGIENPTPSNPLIGSSIGYNIFEIFEIPPVKHYVASYDITFWCQYTQQMNSMLTILMGGYTNNNRPSFRLDTDKGYYFTGFVEDGFSPDVNFDDFTEDERLVKCTINMKVQAYLVAPRSIGQPSPIRRYVSAPNISFTIHEGFDVVGPGVMPAVDSNKTEDHVLSDLTHELDGGPKRGVAETIYQQIDSNLDSLGTTTLNNNIGSLGTLRKVRGRDPVTGRERNVEVRVADQNRKTGETVLRAYDFIIKLEDLIKK